jgi:hypothetical protein
MIPERGERKIYTRHHGAEIAPPSLRVVPLNRIDPRAPGGKLLRPDDPIAIEQLAELRRPRQDWGF